MIRPAFQKTCATLLAIAFVLAGLLEPLHQALVQHTVCAEHGELVHGPSDQEPGPADGDEEHEHCKLCVGQRVAAVAAASAVTQAQAPRELVTDATGDADPRVRTIDHRLAPKTSPPRRG